MEKRRPRVHGLHLALTAWSMRDRLSSVLHPMLRSLAVFLGFVLGSFTFGVDEKRRQTPRINQTDLKEPPRGALPCLPVQSSQSTCVVNATIQVPTRRIAGRKAAATAQKQSTMLVAWKYTCMACIMRFQSSTRESRAHIHILS